MDRSARRARAARRSPGGQASHRHRADRKGKAAPLPRGRAGRERSVRHHARRRDFGRRPRPLAGIRRARKDRLGLEATAGVARAGGGVARRLDFDVGVASYVVHPSRPEPPSRGPPLEYLGRTLITGLETPSTAWARRRAERARSVLRIERCCASGSPSRTAESLFARSRCRSSPARPHAVARCAHRHALSARSGPKLEPRRRRCSAEIYAIAGTEFNVSSPGRRLREIPLRSPEDLAARRAARQTGLSTTSTC